MTSLQKLLEQLDDQIARADNQIADQLKWLKEKTFDIGSKQGSLFDTRNIQGTAATIEKLGIELNVLRQVRSRVITLIDLGESK